MSILQAHMTKFSFKPEQLKKLIAQDLGKKENEIDVHFIVQDVADDRFGGGPRYELTEIEVRVR